MTFRIKKAISYALIFALCISSILVVYNISELASAADEVSSAPSVVSSTSKVSYTDVTGKVDLSSIALQNLSSSVIENPTTTYKQHTLIVSLEGTSLVDAANGKNVSEYANSVAGQKRTARLQEQQDSFLNSLDALGIEYTLKNRYTVIDNAVAIEANTSYVSVIKEISGVESVCLSERYLEPETVDMGTYATTDSDEWDQALQSASAVISQSSSAVINKTSVYQTGVYDSSSAAEKGYKGAGSVVAIIDTGLDYTHNAFVWDEDHEEKYSLEDSVFDFSTVENFLTKDTMAEQKSALNGKQISANDLYVSQKIPFAYDYADNDTDVYPSYSNHGTHVAGIVAGYDPTGYTDKDGNHINTPFVGVAPEAQLVICKVFTDDLDDSDLGGADTEDILAALEDCVLLGVDVINMSLGTSCGFSTTDDGDEEGEMLNTVYNSVMESGISLVCAASNDYSSAYGGAFGTNLASNPDSGTVGSPSVFAAALSVASISGKSSPYMLANGETAVYYEESSDQYNKYYDFAEMILGSDVDSQEFTYVTVPGTGRTTDYNTASVRNNIKGSIALVERGGITFKEKVENAKLQGAIGIIVYNNVSGTVRMALGEVKNPIPSCCISMEVGQKLASYSTGKIVVNKSYSAGPFMSEFSSWGGTPDLKLKPEITAHGGEITSAVPGGYGEQSGTSMASPNMAGVVSIIRSYLKTTQPELKDNPTGLTQRINQLIMSTATIVYDRDNLPYSPRKQGAGLGSLDNAISTSAYLYTDDASIDYRPKVNLGDDPDKNGVYEVKFSISNFGTEELTFTLNPIFMTEKLAVNNLAVAEQAHILDDIDATWTVSGEGATKDGNKLTVSGRADAEIVVTFTLSDAEKQYIDKSFKNGMYVEGFVNLISETDGQCGLNLPFLGFYGDWAKVPMLDYDAYYIDEAEADTSIDDEDKPQASIWATQPYTKYYQDRFSMPMGSFAYLQDENADRVYTTMDHNAISCYDVFYEEDHVDNYLTTYEFRGLYLGLMRGARKIDYYLMDEATGEILYENTAYRVNKAYSGGGSAVPGYLKFEINPLEYNMVSNGKYRMAFEIYCDYGDETRTDPDDTFEFTFYCDYEAPSLRDVRIRYQDYKENNKTKQRIYLDMDVYDNHYTQATLLCYFDGYELKQVTEYVVPFYNCVKNSTNTVSIEITDIYEQYGDKLYVQFDDYALNHAVYYINIPNANSNPTPSTFELAPGEEAISLDIYETHKVSLIYSGDANLSNFSWDSSNKNVVAVKNGEIVGLSEGTATITVAAGNDDYKKIEVAVSNVKRSLSLPSISFETIVNSADKLSAGDSVSLYPDQDITLTIATDPWYYPKDQLKLKWVSTDTDILEVDENGKLNLKKKGEAGVDAIILREDGSTSSYRATISITVLDPFVVSNYTLSEYRGKDAVVEIPDDEMILYIAEDAFKDNTTMEKVIIPKTVINIYEGAFRNCSALKEVYLVSTVEEPIPDADLKLIYRSAFEGCGSLELLDLTNVKVITVAVNAFKNCSSLSTIKNMKAIGSAYATAFEGCTSLTSVDLTGMQVAGEGVFRNCTSITEILTGQYTAIGEKMFENCTALRSVTLNNSVIGANAFTGCTKLNSVIVNGVSGERFVIENQAFYKSGLTTITFADGCNVRKIGDKAFANTKLKKITLPEGLEEIGANIFAGTTTLKEIVLPASFDYNKITLASGLFAGITPKLAEGSEYVIDEGILYNKDKTTIYAVIDNTITSVTIPSSVKTIYDYAFANSKIGSLNIPETVTEIGVGAFKGSALVSIEINGNGITAIKDYTFNNTDLTSIVLPSSVKSIGAYAFAGAKILSAIDLSGIESIGNYAFSNCIELSSVTVTDSLKAIGDNAFEYCSALSTIELPAVNQVGESVFVKSGLTQIVFGDEATSIGEYAFVGLTKLQKVTLGSNIELIGEFAFADAGALEEVVLGGVKEISAYAFMNCTKLRSIDLSGVEVIGEYAFANCNALGAVKLSSAKVINAGAFMMDNGKGGVSSVQMPVAEEIGAMAFYGTSVTSVTIPASLKYLDYGVFAYTSSLAEITVDDANEIFFTDDGVLYEILANGGYELVLYPSTKVAEENKYSVIDNTVRIDGYAFAGIGKDKEESALGVTHVELPYSLTNIGDGAFYQSGITEYTFNGLNAPVLETVYRAEVDEITAQYGNLLIEPAINSYYYANFNELFVYYIDMVTNETKEYSPMIINRPVNGIGYDNYVYKCYFGTETLTKTVKDEDTILFLEQMELFGDYTEATLQAWQEKANAGDISTYKDDVQAFSDIVKEARRLYDNVKDETQLTLFIDNSLVTMLESAEVQMRSIKKSYGIQVGIKQYLAEEGSYKDTYVAGETFDPTGIVIYRVYDDGSTEVMDSSKLTLQTTYALKYYHQTVKFVDNETGETFEVRVYVSESSDTPVDGDGNQSTGNEDGNSKDDDSLSAGMIAVCVVVPVVGLALIAVAVFFVLKKKKIIGVKHVDTNVNFGDANADNTQADTHDTENGDK